MLTPDWDLWRALLTDDCMLHDRRVAGIGIITGPEWVEAQRVLTELSPDVTTVPTEVLAIADHGWISRVRISGTLADGGPFESDHVDLFTIARGRITHVEMFDPAAIAEARARFEALRPEEPVIPPNAVVRAGERHDRAVDLDDWAALRENCAPELVVDDHRALIRERSDRDAFVASMQLIVPPRRAPRARAARNVRRPPRTRAPAVERRTVR